ncbi:hypothetical protein DM02DRAFT_609999 [Periconia macrospinosa]|uniref:BZIP domain-containing protein n=1 Tax=Periconia macrospinosa TaxID=97972 RepID=A0A2V1E7T0_9PLEO|nr:hypothetical protein DM02DRAFT_609999 [Periconia macrospinosa]
MPSQKQHQHHQASNTDVQSPTPSPSPTLVTISSLLSSPPEPLSTSTTSSPTTSTTTSIAGLAPKRSVATASSPPAVNSQPSPEGAGPLSGTYVIHPRPKPGRKPSKDEPASKRKAQNRCAQQKFRAKKVQKLEELSIQLQGAQEENKRLLVERQAREARMREMEMELQQARELQATTARERDFWRNQHSTTSQASLAEAAAVLQSQFSRKDSTVMEIDFTGYRTPDTTMDVSCGNCTPNGHCACVAEYTRLDEPGTGSSPGARS